MLDSSHSFLTWRKKLKENILSRKFTDHYSAKEFEQLLFILNRTIKYGESDSVLLIGFRGSGKTSVSKVLLIYLLILLLLIWDSQHSTVIQLLGGQVQMML